jgi:hypothetical protein
MALIPKFEILDAERKAMCLGLLQFKNDFYLAGGTGLALQVGHRISEDFDFFTEQPFDNDNLLKRVGLIFPGDSLTQLQNEPRTLTLLIRGVKISFFCIDSPPVTPLEEVEYFRIASIQEIGIFKLLALPRASFKDYVDLFFILQHCSLKDLLDLARRKYPDFNEALYLKAFLSYSDVDLSPVQFTPGNEIANVKIFAALQRHAEDYIQSLR